MMPTLEEQAAAIRQRYQSDLTQLRTDTRLTPQGKAEKAAELWESADYELTQLKGRYDAEQDAHRAGLERKVFSGADLPMVEYRQALATAAGIGEEQEAAMVFDRSARAGDTVMTRALAAVSLERPDWPGIQQRFAESDPGRAEAFTELQRLNDPGRSVAHYLSHGIVFESPEVPGEARGLVTAPRR